MRYLAILAVLLAVIALALIRSRKSDTPESPLIQAAENGDVAAIRCLLEAGADPDVPGGAGGWTPLMHAIRGNRTGAVLELLEGGADVNARGGNDDTPPMMAAGYGLTEIVRILLEGGADAYARKEHGLTALDTALIGVADTGRFTLTSCQASTVEALLEGAPELTYYGDLAEILFLRLKHCPEVDRILEEREVPRLRPRLR